MEMICLEPSLSKARQHEPRTHVTQHSCTRTPSSHISANWRGGKGLAWFTDKLSQYVGANQKWTAVALQTCTGLEWEWRGELFSTGGLVLTNSNNWGTPGSYSTWINPFLNFTLSIWFFSSSTSSWMSPKVSLGPSSTTHAKGKFWAQCVLSWKLQYAPFLLI